MQYTSRYGKLTTTIGSEFHALQVSDTRVRLPHFLSSEDLLFCPKVHSRGVANTLHYVALTKSDPPGRIACRVLHLELNKSLSGGTHMLSD